LAGPVPSYRNLLDPNSIDDPSPELQEGYLSPNSTQAPLVSAVGVSGWCRSPRQAKAPQDRWGAGTPC